MDDPTIRNLNKKFAFDVVLDLDSTPLEYCHYKFSDLDVDINLNKKWNDYIRTFDSKIKDNEEKIFKYLFVSDDDNSRLSSVLNDSLVDYDETRLMMLLPSKKQLNKIKERVKEMIRQKSKKKTKRGEGETALTDPLEQILVKVISKERPLYLGLRLTDLYLRWFIGHNGIMYTFSDVEDEPNTEKMINLASDYKSLLGGYSFSEISFTSMSLINAFNNIYNSEGYLKVTGTFSVRIIFYLIECVRFRVLRRQADFNFTKDDDYRWDENIIELINNVKPFIESSVKNWSQYSKRLFREDIENDNDEKNQDTEDDDSDQDQIDNMTFFDNDNLCKTLQVRDRRMMHEILTVALHSQFAQM